MKLFRCSAFGIDWEAQDYLVTETEDEARERFHSTIEDSHGWCAGAHVYEATEVDGYKVMSISKTQLVLSK